MPKQSLWDPTQFYLLRECAQARSSLCRRGSDSHTEDWREKVSGPNCPCHKKNREENIGRLLSSWFFCVKPFYCAGETEGLKPELCGVIFHFEIGILSFCLRNHTGSWEGVLKNSTTNKVMQTRKPSCNLPFTVYFCSSWLSIVLCSACLYLSFTFQMYYVTFSFCIFKDYFSFEFIITSLLPSFFSF